MREDRLDMRLKQKGAEKNRGRISKDEEGSGTEQRVIGTVL